MKMSFNLGGSSDRPNWWETPISGALDRLPIAGMVGQFPSPLPKPVLDQAVASIRLDPTRKERIRSALGTLEARLRNDASLAGIMRRFAVQGSFALDTAIRPLADGSFDVDVLVVLDIRRLPLRRISPAGAVELVYSALDGSAWYSKRLVPKARCLRIAYEEGFHVDVVPAHCDTRYSPTSGPALIANRQRDAWEETHPLGYKAWFDALDSQNGGRLRQVVCLTKRWRDETREVEIPSLLLTTLLGYSAKCSSMSLGRSVALTLAQLRDTLASYSRVPIVPNPSLVTENLARDWDQGSYDRFKVALGRAAALATEANAGRNARAHWRELFGTAVPS